MGIVISVGSKTDSTVSFLYLTPELCSEFFLQQRPVARSLIKFTQGLPLSRSPTSPYSVLELVNDLINHAKSNMASNAIVVPVFQTFTILLEADALRQVPRDPYGLQRSVCPYFIGSNLS